MTLYGVVAVMPDHDALMIPDADVPMILNGDARIIPGDAVSGTGWHLSALLRNFINPFPSSEIRHRSLSVCVVEIHTTSRGVSPRCRLGVRAVQGLLEAWITGVVVVVL